MILYLPFLISIIIGVLALRYSLKDPNDLPFPLYFFLGGGIGLALSSFTVFASFITFNSLNNNFVIGFNFILLLIFFSGCIWNCVHLKQTFWPKASWTKNNLWPFLFLLAISIPLWKQAHYYAYGGWDAWSTWNLKAKFMYLHNGEAWRKIFDPLFWRASPHYQLLLPSTIVWGWISAGEATHFVPVFVAFLFTFLTIGALFLSLKELTRSIWTILCALVLFTHPHYLLIALSQYCDIVLGYYLLASIICLTFARINNKPSLNFLAGIFLGCLAFTKPEGMVASLLIVLFIPIYFFINNKHKDYPFTARKHLWKIAKGLVWGSIPVVIFQLFYAPKNITFINGLTSLTNPSNWSRLEFIFAYYAAELVKTGWNGLWIVLILLMFFNAKRIFDRRFLVFPYFIFSYMAVTTFYYYLNTYFKIGWWLQVTLHRILFAVLPTFIFWIFLMTFAKFYPQSQPKVKNIKK